MDNVRAASVRVLQTLSANLDGISDRRFFCEKGAAAEVAKLVEPVLTDLGFHLVRVVVSGRDGGTVQIMAERSDGDIGVDECATISRNLSPLFEAYEPLPGSYRLEISSPGIDRPLVRPRDLERWTGFEAKVEMRELVDGRRRFRGKLDGIENDALRLQIESDGASGPQKIQLPVALIDQAKLVMTNTLIEAALSRRKS